MRRYGTLLELRGGVLRVTVRVLTSFVTNKWNAFFGLVSILRLHSGLHLSDFLVMLRFLSSTNPMLRTQIKHCNLRRRLSAKTKCHFRQGLNSTLFVVDFCVDAVFIHMGCSFYSDQYSAGGQGVTITLFDMAPGPRHCRTLNVGIASSRSASSIPIR